MFADSERDREAAVAAVAIYAPFLEAMLLGEGEEEEEEREKNDQGKSRLKFKISGEKKKKEKKQQAESANITILNSRALLIDFLLRSLCTSIKSVVHDDELLPDLARP